MKVSLNTRLGTLALGINAPTKTSVFCGDSPFLTALMVRSPSSVSGHKFDRPHSTVNVPVVPVVEALIF